MRIRGVYDRALRRGPLARHLTSRLQKFGAEEDGVMIVFSIFMLTMILMVAGVGVDIMRYERDRATLQATLDRAVLAAADLDQERAAREVVEDYFAKAGISNYLSSVTPEEGLGYKTVSATASASVNTVFMNLLGIDSFQASAGSTAEERIGSVEISLVLDVSGSMDWNSRLVNLKPAAKDFVDAVIDSAPPGKVSVSIIPYATQVSAGQDILDLYTTTAEHDYSHCVNFNANEFQRTALSTEDELELTGHFDVYTYSEDPIEKPVCPVEQYAHILPLSSDKSVLHAKIDSLQADGNTSIDLGVKWGTTLLDPGTQDVVNDLIAGNIVESEFAGRPAAYTEGQTLKVMVVMSDGENTSQYMLNPSLRDGDSDVWYNETADRYSIQRSQGQSTEYWWPHNSSWNDHPFGQGTYQNCTRERQRIYYYDWWGRQRSYWGWVDVCTEQDEPGTAVRLTYPELWNRTSLAWNAEYNYTFQGNRWQAWYNNAYTHKNATAKDQQTKHICGAAKDEGVVIFTVGFEAPEAGQNVLRDCASSDSHHFDVDGLEIEDAFAAIAASVRKLRLTQ